MMHSFDHLGFLLVKFSASTVDYFASSDIDETLGKIDSEHQFWLRCRVHPGQHTVTKIIDHFHLSHYRIRRILTGKPLAIDDQDLDDCLFANYQILSRTLAELGIKEIWGSFILGENFFISFETQGTVLFDNIFSNLQNQLIDLKSHRADYLLYLAYEELIDNYYTVFDRISWQLEELEDLILDGISDKSTYRKIARMRQSVRLGRRNLLSVKAVAIQSHHHNIRWISATTAEKLNHESFPHLEALSQEYQSLRSWMTELMEIQRSNINDQVGRVINRLTLISAIFLPIQFITGLYGMNFDYMPELHWRLAYPMTLLVMGLIAVVGWRYAQQQNLFD
ncbi:MAG: CorA family divalent cation transporter [Leptolyngbyaceae cyanobacterium]